MLPWDGTSQTSTYDGMEPALAVWSSWPFRRGRAGRLTLSRACQPISRAPTQPSASWQPGVGFVAWLCLSGRTLESWNMHTSRRRKNVDDGWWQSRDKMSLTTTYLPACNYRYLTVGRRL